MTKNNEQIEKIYICDYGQTEFPVCVDLGHEYCKLDFQKSKECNLRAVVSYDEYLRKEQECEELKAENNTYKSSIIANLDRNISKRYEELLEENDQLKETIEGLLSIQYKLADNNKQLRQTLAEIKEICKNVMPTGIDEETDKFGDILDILNEVEE